MEEINISKTKIGIEEGNECMSFIVHNKECYSNDFLYTKGYVFIRDIYEYFGIEITLESITHGWNKDIKGDVVDLGIRIDLNTKDVFINCSSAHDITNYFK